ncbi:MAG TPA: hypothetical protein VK524_14805, partial [Polyangiaceae bacterium]|nr:hypothetical protein [Polyangiaceae bacterium]
MFQRKIRARICTLAFGLALFGCGDAGVPPGTSGQPDPSNERPGTPGTAVQTELPPAEAEQAQRIRSELDGVKNLN